MNSSQNSEPNRLLGLLSDGALHSGAALADSLGISRAAVWKRIKRLQTLGYPIVAQPGQGYRWHGPVTPLCRERICDALRLRDPAARPEVRVLESVDSTNRVLRESNPGRPTVLFAEYQSAGRGRMGRQWLSPRGGLYGSLAWRFDDLPRGPVGLSILCGLEVALAFRGLGAGGVGVKWPNDLVVGDAKLGGILIEVTGEVAGPCRVVIGIGINWSDLGDGGPQDRQTIGLTSLLEPSQQDRNAVAAQVVGALIDACQACPDRLAERLAQDWERVDALAGRAVRVSQAGEEREGVACGVDDNGGFRLQEAAGMVVFHSGEVSVRPRS
jgi:BirA family biotin operon repressor/biotin-[acetyl-CoA-carboxylase] ligase